MNRRDEAFQTEMERRFTHPTPIADPITAAKSIFDAGYEAATADNEKLREALQAIKHIADGHGGCDKHEPLCASCEAHRLAKQALDTAERATDADR